MRLFIDSASIEEVREIAKWGCLSGATTNPTLLAREGGDATSTVADICSLVDGPVSVEVMAETSEEMVREAVVLAALHPNVIIKVPMCTEGLRATRRLNDMEVKTNVTLVFSLNQALLAAESGATYVSVFMGRLDDIGVDSTGALREILQAYAAGGVTTQVIAASIRNPAHANQAALAGARFATVPPSVLRQMAVHGQTEEGIRRFRDDWEAALRA